MAEPYPESFEFAHRILMLKIPAHTPDVPKGSHHMYDAHLQYGDLLFDLEADPDENINIIKERPDVLERMTVAMKKLMEESEAPREQYERMEL